MNRISVFSLIIIMIISHPLTLKGSEIKFTRGIRPSTIKLQPYLLGKYQYDTIIQCAAMCMYTAECRSYLYGKASPPDECYTTASHRQYTGRWNVTESGIPCQSFTAQFPHNHSAYIANDLYPDGIVAAGNNCRDPSDSGYLWCYTLNETVRYELCDIQRCTDENCVLYNTTSIPGTIGIGVVEYYQHSA